MMENSGNGAVTQDATREPTERFSRSELVQGWRAYHDAVPTVVPVLKYAAKTDMGQVRENNEDKFDIYEPEDPGVLAARGSLFIVADGVGGAQAGQIASEMLVKTLIRSYYDHPAADVETALRDSVTLANDRIHGLAQLIPERTGMGSTLTAAAFIEDRVVITQVGDSRAYLVRGDDMTQLTTDHSWVEEQVRAGLMSRDQAEQSPLRNVITRSVGAAPNVDPDFYRLEVRAGDTFILCSDGLTGHVDDSEIFLIARQHAPSEAARQFIDLANSRGGRDNITVVIVSVRELRHVESGNDMRWSVEPAPVAVPAVAADTGGDAHVPGGRPAALPHAGPDAPMADQRSRWRRLLGR